MELRKYIYKYLNSKLRTPNPITSNPMLMSREFTSENFEKEVLKSGEPVMVDFWAPWCGPCKALGPIIDELAEEFDGMGIRIGKVNIDENSALASEYGIMSIPTTLFFRGGKPVDQVTGLQAKGALAEKIKGMMQE